jgi:hypothetical protein
MYGIGNINFFGNMVPAGVVTDARNGTSKDASNFVVLGQELGDPLNPAELLSPREIPMPFGMFIGLTETGVNRATALAPADIIMQGDTTSPGEIEIQMLNNGGTAGAFTMQLDTETGQRMLMEYVSSPGTSEIIWNNSGLLQLLSTFAMINGPGVRAGSPGASGFGYARNVIELNAGANNADLAHTGTLYCTGNTGGMAATLNLPGWSQGAHYTIVLNEAFQVDIVADGTDIIRILSADSSAGGTATAVQRGDWLTLEATINGVWSCTSLGGTWTLA